MYKMYATKENGGVEYWSNGINVLCLLENMCNTPILHHSISVLPLPADGDSLMPKS